MGGGVLQYSTGGQVKFYPYNKGSRISYSHAEGGHRRFWELKVLVIV